METQASFRNRWKVYRPSKATWLMSCVACVIAAIIVGFNWGGWLTWSTAMRISVQAAQQARADLAATYCVSQFEAAPDAGAKLALLKETQSWLRSDFIDKGGWVKLPGLTQNVDGAADLCARKLVGATLALPKPAAASG